MGHNRLIYKKELATKKQQKTTTPEYPIIIELVMHGVRSPPAVCVQELHVFSFRLGPWFSVVVSVKHRQDGLGVLLVQEITACRYQSYV